MSERGSYSQKEPYRGLLHPSDKTIVFAVIDGLGGIPHPDYDNFTELEYAQTPDLDRLATESTNGTHIPISPGITPGSIPAHLSVFGYDPYEYLVGRGVVEALGLGVDLQEGDIAIRCNWCTLDDDGRMVDRRAGRPTSEESAQYVTRLQTEINIPGVDVALYPGSEHRFVAVLRGDGLGASVSETDPQAIGVPLIQPAGSDETSAKTAHVLQEIMRQTFPSIAGDPRLNAFAMRGYSTVPNIPSFNDRYGLSAQAVVTHPAYRGIGRLLGMDIAQVNGKSAKDVIAALAQNWGEHQFHYLHFKWPDTYGENKDFEAKSEELELVSNALAGIQDLNPDVIIVTGDHATPARLGTHSWHPVPTMLWTREGTHFRDDVHQFGERATRTGYLGHKIAATNIMPEVLAHAGMLDKFGA